jgi:MFS family permease
MEEQRTHIVTDINGVRIPERTIRTGLRLTILTGSISTIWLTITLGMPLQMFFEALGATGFVIGLAGTLQQGAMIAQIPGAIITEKLSSRRIFVVVLIIIQRSIWVLPAVIILFFPLDITAQIILLVLVGASAFAGQCVSAGWFSWMADLIPAHLSGRYWGARQMWTTFAMVITLIIVGQYLDFMTDQGQIFWRQTNPK